VNTWKVIVATIVIFAAGAVTGALLVRQSFRPRPGPGGVRLDFLRRMERDLDLTREQRQKIDKILKESQDQMRRIMEPVSPALHAELQRTKEEFRQVLTPQQQARFDQLLKHPSHARDSHRPASPSETLSLTNSPQPMPVPR
jgi:Spy/CpxP family protein refolding chaperone